MGKIAFVFSGQGAQYPSMGKELCEASPAAAKVFEIADSIREDTSKQCFEGTKEELFLTINTQPCMFCVDLAAAEALNEAGIKPDAVAGFSLGEVPAVTFAGMLSVEDGFKLVVKRGEFMNAAAVATNGAMCAVVKLKNDVVEGICAEFEDAYPVNYNCPGQLSCAVGKDNMAAFCERVKEAGGRAIPLAVSGGFHSPFMTLAAAKMRTELENYTFEKPNIAVYSNFTAERYTENPAELLASQVENPVRWQEIIENMIESGIDTFIECGPGKTLAGLVAKISKDVKIYNVENKETLEKAIAELK